MFSTNCAEISVDVHVQMNGMKFTSHHLQKLINQAKDVNKRTVRNFRRNIDKLVTFKLGTILETYVITIEKRKF